MCGKLICIYQSEDILKMRSAIVIYANISGQICISLEYPPGHKESKKMWVRDGTVCGSGKVGHLLSPNSPGPCPVPSSPSNSQCCALCPYWYTCLWRALAALYFLWKLHKSSKETILRFTHCILLHFQNVCVRERESQPSDVVNYLLM